MASPLDQDYVPEDRTMGGWERKGIARRLFLLTEMRDMVFPKEGIETGAG
jgi:hypothetical protein